jgi:dTDP-4-dehydrorhamnose reductase
MIVVTGASGQLGTALCAALGDRALPLGRDRLDLEHPESIAATLSAVDAEGMVNCAAYTAVDRAEGDPDRARLVNAVAVGELARVCADRRWRFITLSTDYVFDGEKAGPYFEDDAPNPRSVYGTTKLEGERLALELHPQALVVRTSWVLSGTHPNFIATMLRLVSEGPVKVVDDQVGCPTLVDDLAPAIVEAFDIEADGVLHLTNQGAVSWFQLAREGVALAGLDESRVTPCATEDFPRPAPRPRNSVLGSKRRRELGLNELPHYGAGLRRAVALLGAEAA